jgi:hypothetical protein
MPIDGVYMLKRTVIYLPIQYFGKITQYEQGEKFILDDGCLSEKTGFGIYLVNF